MISQSIHPRNGIHGNRKVKNTCKPGMTGKYLRKAKRFLSIRVDAHTATLKSLPGSTNPLSFRKPGSMKWR